MKRGIWLVAVVIGVAAAVMMQSVAAGHKAAGHKPAGHRPAGRIAGPWYTPQELEALIADSDLPLVQRSALLASVNGSTTWPRHHVVVTQAGPWYTPSELRALVARSKEVVNGLLVYEAKIGKHYQLFTIRADGSDARQLTDFADGDAVWAAWSPSGNRIAFERDVFAGVRVTRAAISTMNADGSGLRSLTPTGLNGRPSWSPDGARIVFSSLRYGKQATVSLMAANGSHVRKLVTTPLPANGGGIGLDSPSFSPDGKRVAFVWRKQGVAAIFTTNATGGALKQVTSWQHGGLADKIDWSPDGSRIAFSSPDPGVLPGISSNVFTVRPDGSGLLRITNSRGGRIHNGLDSWSPDGTKIAFARIGGGGSEIYTMNADGSGVTRLTRGPEAHHASWGTHP